MSEKTFSDFYESLLELVKSYEEKNTMLKVEENLESNIIRIYGEKINSISRAKNGIDDVAELAYTVAEHHPYWGLLYNCTQIAKIALDKWDDNLSKDELDEIDWSLDELKNTCKKLKEDLSSQ
ncbi:hypothetical protein MnTg01_01063 [archaeon MnTg01]|nr:hypothetical protein MnTg01_01063 [archaeon MnTg01]